MMKRVLVCFAGAMLAVSVGGCAALSGMVVGSKGWFEKQKPDVEEKAAADLECSGQPIEYTAVTLDDYREVEARGCGRKARYQYTKIGPVESWKKSSGPEPL